MKNCRHGMASGRDKPAVARRDFMRLGAGVASIAALEAGGARAQNRPTPGGSIDLHTHWTPPVYLTALSKMKVAPGATLGTAATGAESPSSNMEKRIEWMDAHGVQTHVLTLAGGMPWQWVSIADGNRLAQLVNDAAIEAHAKYPTRVLAGIEINVRDPQGALREIERVAGKPGLCAVHLPNSMDNRDYVFESDFGPLLERVEALGYPLLFHPLDGEQNIYGGAERLGNALAVSANISNTLGFTFDSATTAAKFIITGTLDRLPNLAIVLPHSGGCFPYIAGRVERGLRARRFAMQRPFKEYLRRFHYDTLAWYPETLRFLISLVGADRVVIGTDNYAIMDVEYPNALVESIGLPPAELEMILRGNARRLLNIRS